MPKGIPGPNVTMNSGRRAVGSAIAKSGFAVGSGPKDSGGKIFNPDQKAKSNSLAAASSAPITGMIPNTVAAGNPIGAPGSGKVTKKMAGIAKFYGR